MQLRLPALLVAVGAVAALNGCGDPTGARANVANFENRLTVYGLNGTPSTFPSGVLMQEGVAVRVDASFAFDLAFDVKAADSVAVYTPGFLASELATPGRVGLKKAEQAFDAAITAPTSGYAYDSLLVVPVNQTVFVDVIDRSCFGSIFGPNIRGKIVVDSLDAPRSIIYLHVLVNRNCGLKSLVPAGEIPKD